MASTVISFTYSDKNLFDKVKTWATENNYKVKQSNDNYMLLQKGGYFSFNAHPNLMVDNKDGQVTMEAWISPIWGGKMEISSDNPLGFAAKGAARGQINKLLTILNQKPIT